MANTVLSPTGAAAPAYGNSQVHPKTGFLALTIGSIGVVYGDIGTSPLYALREAVVAAVGPNGTITQEVVLGVLSLILWSLLVVVTLKYVVILLRADNNGEGGTLALMALAQRALGRSSTAIFLLGAAGAALFYGDAIITPAISVLSAVEGLKIVTPTFEPYVVPLTVVILVLLFMVQSRGTAKVAAFFGPITAVWFIAIAVAGIVKIAENPGVLEAANPAYAIVFLANHGVIGLVTLGAVFLAVTGAEALYADLGHFGRRPIQAAWIVLVLPALLINYFGQGAFLLANPKAIENPFFLMVPDWALLPMVALATAATVIASSGGDHRRVFVDATGDPARAAAAFRNSSHLGVSVRANLLAARELAASDRRSPARGPVPLIERACHRLWHRGHRNHGGHDTDGVCGDLEGMEVEPHRCGGPDRPSGRNRFHVSCGKSSEGRRRRLDLALGWRLAHRGDVDLAARRPHPVREDAAARSAAARSYPQSRVRSLGIACRALPFFSPAIRRAHPPRSCTASSITGCCTSAT